MRYARMTFHDISPSLAHFESMPFAENLRRLMKERGIAAAQLGPRLGITPTAVRQWMRGEHAPVGKRLADLANALGARPEDLFAQPTGFSEKPTLYQRPSEPDESHRLPDVVEMLSDQLATDGISIGPRRITVHALAALQEASRMPRALCFEERARLAVEAKAADLRRRLD